MLSFAIKAPRLTSQVNQLTFRRTFLLLRKSPPLYAHLANQCPHLAPSDSQHRIALSLSPNPNAVILGSIPHEQIEDYKTVISYSEEQVTDSDPDNRILVPNVADFHEDPAFVPIAQRIIKHNIHNCPYYVPLAQAESSEDTQFFHVFDLRCPPPAGRIPYVEDILGTVRLENGTIVPDSYEPNSMYRVITKYGPFSVSSFLTKLIRQKLEEESTK